MDALQQALREHEKRLEELRIKAEHLDDALAGGHNLRKVVGAARTVRQDLADIHANFQARFTCSPRYTPIHVPFPVPLCPGLSSRLLTCF
jgi:hypothetical protein